MHWFLKFIFEIKLYMFWAVPLSIIRSFLLYTQQCHTVYTDSLRARSGRNFFRPDPPRKLSASLYDIRYCCVYSAEFLMMDRGTFRNIVPSWSYSQAVRKPVWYISLLCVQWKPPDNGQRTCPKHVEIYSKNKFEIFCASSWFYYKNSKQEII